MSASKVARRLDLVTESRHARPFLNVGGHELPVVRGQRANVYLEYGAPGMIPCPCASDLIGDAPVAAVSACTA